MRENCKFCGLLLKTITEDLIGMHQACQFDAYSIDTIMKSVLLCVGLELKHARGQTYDGTGT